MWESIFEQESMTKVDFYPSTPLLDDLDIFHDSVIPIKSFKEPVFNDVIFDQNQNSWDVSFTYESGEGKYSLLDLSNP